MSAGLEWGILLPALLAGLMVLASHVPLGMRVLERGIIFIDIAIAQFAGLGVILAHFMHWEGAWATQAAALGLAAAGALLLRYTEKKWPQVQEAVIGVAFVVVASAAILMLAHDAHGGEHLQEMLVGQILWTGWGDLPLLALVNVAVLLAWLGGLRHSPLGFYLLFAVAITASVQVVGVYLVFASLIMPALAVRRLPGWIALTAGWGIGFLGYAAGLALSAILDLPSGATVVCALALVALMFAFAFMPVWRSARERLGIK